MNQKIKKVLLLGLFSYGSAFGFSYEEMLELFARVNWHVESTVLTKKFPWCPELETALAYILCKCTFSNGSLEKWKDFKQKIDALRFFRDIDYYSNKNGEDKRVIVPPELIDLLSNEGLLTDCSQSTFDSSKISKYWSKTCAEDLAKTITASQIRLGVDAKKTLPIDKVRNFLRTEFKEKLVITKSSDHPHAASFKSIFKIIKSSGNAYASSLRQSFVNDHPNTRSPVIPFEKVQDGLLNLYLRFKSPQDWQTCIVQHGSNIQFSIPENYFSLDFFQKNRLSSYQINVARTQTHFKEIFSLKLSEWETSVILQASFFLNLMKNNKLFISAAVPWKKFNQENRIQGSVDSSQRKFAFWAQLAKTMVQFFDSGCGTNDFLKNNIKLLPFHVDLTCEELGDKKCMENITSLLDHLNVASVFYSNIHVKNDVEKNFLNLWTDKSKTSSRRLEALKTLTFQNMSFGKRGERAWLTVLNAVDHIRMPADALLLDWSEGRPLTMGSLIPKIKKKFRIVSFFEISKLSEVPEVSAVPEKDNNLQRFYTNLSKFFSDADWQATCILDGKEEVIKNPSKNIDYVFLQNAQKKKAISLDSLIKKSIEKSIKEISVDRLYDPRLSSQWIDFIPDDQLREQALHDVSLIVHELSPYYWRLWFFNKLCQEEAGNHLWQHNGYLHTEMRNNLDAMLKVFKQLKTEGLSREIWERMVLLRQGYESIYKIDIDQDKKKAAEDMIIKSFKSSLYSEYRLEFINFLNTFIDLSYANSLKSDMQKVVDVLAPSYQELLSLQQTGDMQTISDKLNGLLQEINIIKSPAIKNKIRDLLNSTKAEVEFKSLLSSPDLDQIKMKFSSHIIKKIFDHNPAIQLSEFITLIPDAVLRENIHHDLKIVNDSIYPNYKNLLLLLESKKSHKQLHPMGEWSQDERRKAQEHYESIMNSACNHMKTDGLLESIYRNMGPLARDFAFKDDPMKIRRAENAIINRFYNPASFQDRPTFLYTFFNEKLKQTLKNDMDYVDLRLRPAYSEFCFPKKESNTNIRSLEKLTDLLTAVEKIKTTAIKKRISSYLRAIEYDMESGSIWKDAGIPPHEALVKQVRSRILSQIFDNNGDNDGYNIKKPSKIDASKFTDFIPDAELRENVCHDLEIVPEIRSLYFSLYSYLESANQENNRGEYARTQIKNCCDCITEKANNNIKTDGLCKEIYNKLVSVVPKSIVPHVVKSDPRKKAAEDMIIKSFKHSLYLDDKMLPELLDTSVLQSDMKHVVDVLAPCYQKICFPEKEVDIQSKAFQVQNLLSQIAQIQTKRIRDKIESQAKHLEAVINKKTDASVKEKKASFDEDVQIIEKNAFNEKKQKALVNEKKASFDEDLQIENLQIMENSDLLNPIEPEGGLRIMLRSHHPDLDRIKREFKSLIIKKIFGNNRAINLSQFIPLIPDEVLKENLRHDLEIVSEMHFLYVGVCFYLKSADPNKVPVIPQIRDCFEYIAERANNLKTDGLCEEICNGFVSILPDESMALHVVKNDPNKLVSIPGSREPHVFTNDKTAVEDLIIDTFMNTKTYDLIHREILDDFIDTFTARETFKGVPIPLWTTLNYDWHLVSGPLNSLCQKIYFPKKEDGVQSRASQVQNLLSRTTEIQTKRIRDQIESQIKALFDEDVQIIEKNAFNEKKQNALVNEKNASFQEDVQIENLQIMENSDLLNPIEQKAKQGSLLSRSVDYLAAPDALDNALDNNIKSKVEYMIRFFKNKARSFAYDRGKAIIYHPDVPLKSIIDAEIADPDKRHHRAWSETYYFMTVMRDTISGLCQHEYVLNRMMIAFSELAKGLDGASKAFSFATREDRLRFIELFSTYVITESVRHGHNDLLELRCGECNRDNKVSFFEKEDEQMTSPVWEIPPVFESGMPIYQCTSCEKRALHNDQNFFSHFFYRQASPDKKCAENNAEATVKKQIQDLQSKLEDLFQHSIIDWYEYNLMAKVGRMITAFKNPGYNFFRPSDSLGILYHPGTPRYISDAYSKQYGIKLFEREREYVEGAVLSILHKLYDDYQADWVEKITKEAFVKLFKDFREYPDEGRKWLGFFSAHVVLESIYQDTQLCSMKCGHCKRGYIKPIKYFMLHSGERLQKDYPFFMSVYECGGCKKTFSYTDPEFFSYFVSENSVSQNSDENWVAIVKKQIEDLQNDLWMEIFSKDSVFLYPDMSQELQKQRLKYNGDPLIAIEDFFASVKKPNHFFLEDHSGHLLYTPTTHPDLLHYYSKKGRILSGSKSIAACFAKFLYRVMLPVLYSNAVDQRLLNPYQKLIGLGPDPYQPDWGQDPKKFFTFLATHIVIESARINRAKPNVLLGFQCKDCGFKNANNYFERKSFVSSEKNPSAQTFVGMPVYECTGCKQEASLEKGYFAHFFSRNSNQERVIKSRGDYVTEIANQAINKLVDKMWEYASNTKSIY